MKLETTLDRRPGGGALLAPLVDGLLIALVLFLVGTQLGVQSGLPVDVPSSGLRLAPLKEGHVLVLSASSWHEEVVENPDVDGDEALAEPETVRVLTPPRLALDGRELSLEDLPEKLAELRERSEKKVVVLHADKLSTHGIVLQVSAAILEAGFELAYGMREEQG